MRVMVTGANGMLGQDVVCALTGRGHEVVPVSHAALDITSLDKVRETMAGQEPEVVINCAAYTAVDAAESDWERLWR